MYYYASCSIIRNEYPGIFDFVKIHRALGCEHFLFFDRSDDPLKNHFKSEKDITIINFPEPKRHAEAWMEGIKFYWDKARWVQFIDADQILFPCQVSDNRILLQEYENYPIIGFNWHSFGSNGLNNKPENTSDYEAYTKRAKGNCLPTNSINDHIQTICDPKAVQLVKWPDPHHPYYNQGQFQVNEHKQIMPFNSPFNRPATQDKAFIAHYYTRCRTFWEKKLARGRADTGTEVGTMADFDHHNAYMNEVEDTRIKEFWEKHCK